MTFKIGDDVSVGGLGLAFLVRNVPHAWKKSGPGIARVLFLYAGSGRRLLEEMLELPSPMSVPTRPGSARPTAGKSSANPL